MVDHLYVAELGLGLGLGLGDTSIEKALHIEWPRNRQRGCESARQSF